MVLHAFPQDPETQATPEQLNTAALQRIDIVSRETEAQGLGALKIQAHEATRLVLCHPLNHAKNAEASVFGF